VRFPPQQVLGLRTSPPPHILVSLPDAFFLDSPFQGGHSAGIAFFFIVDLFAGRRDFLSSVATLLLVFFFFSLVFSFFSFSRRPPGLASHTPSRNPLSIFIQAETGPPFPPFFLLTLHLSPRRSNEDRRSPLRIDVVPRPPLRVMIRSLSRLRLSTPSPCGFFFSRETVSWPPSRRSLFKCPFFFDFPRSSVVRDPHAR